MLLRSRGVGLVGLLVTVTLILVWAQRRDGGSFPGLSHRLSGHQLVEPIAASAWQKKGDEDYLWRTVTRHHTVATTAELPAAAPTAFPRVQATFETPSKEALAQSRERQNAVKAAFQRSWTAYRSKAWMADELQPVSGDAKNVFGGWAMTLVDALDTLWIMGLEAEFAEAVAAANMIDFTKTMLDEVNIFTATTRFLGGFLAAFDLSGDPRLLRKAAEVGEMILKAFDTPNNMPVTHWKLKAAAAGEQQVAGLSATLAEVGSLCLELTRLSQITGDPRWFDASQRIMDALAEQQGSTLLPGQWPLAVDTEKMLFNAAGEFSFGSMADSVYEVLPKMAALLGGRLPAYQTMYARAMDAALKYNLFRPMTPERADILVAGVVKSREDGGRRYYELEAQSQHLACFLGGTMALGGRLFERDQDLAAAAKLTDGCVYVYSAFPNGIMPEAFWMLPCESRENCGWDEGKWKEEVIKKVDERNEEVVAADTVIENEHLPRGFTQIPDRRYVLRPEAAESVFIMYRTTADAKYADAAWTMFEAIDKVTRTELANSAVWDVTVPGAKPAFGNSMESFWMGGTLKYFYLAFSDPNLISLDDYVFNTEAHPLRRVKS